MVRIDESLGRRVRRFAAAVCFSVCAVSVTALAGCGQKGPLVMPAADSPPQPPGAASVEPSAQSNGTH